MKEKVLSPAVLRRILWVIALIALAMTLYYMGVLVLAQEVFNGVCGIFWTIGRALLNGFTLYEDIFETKPPLIFLLSAASLAMFGNQSLGYVLHTVLLFAVPAGLVWYAARRTAGSRSKELLLLALFLGSLLVRYLSRHPTGWAIEFYGLAFTMLYLLLLADKREIGFQKTALLTACLIGAIGMKESFLLVAMAGACIVAPSVRTWIRGVVIPVIITGVAGVMGLLALGSLDAYVSVYLPEMFGYYVQRFYIPFILKGLVFDKVIENVAAFSWPFLVLLIVAFFWPLFVGRSTKEKDLVWTWILRMYAMLSIVLFSATSFIFQTSQDFLFVVAALALYRAWRYQEGRGLHIVSAVAAILMVSVRYVCYIIRFVGGFFTSVDSSVCTAPAVIAFVLVAMLIPVLIATILALNVPREHDHRPLAVAIASVLGSSLALYFVILLKIPIPFLWTNIVFPIAALFVAWTWWKNRANAQGAVLQGLGLRFIGFFIVAYSISMGSDYQGHHFLSVIPFLLAVLLPVIDVLAARSQEEGGRRMVMLWLLAVSLVIIANPLRHPSLDDLPAALAASRAQVSELEAEAAAVDALLDACTVEQYLAIRTSDFPAFTRHTPNNYFLWAGLEAIKHHPVVSERTLRSVATADIIIIGDTLPPPEEQTPEEAGTLSYIQEHFTDQPRDCAKGIVLPQTITAYYRLTERL